MLNPFKKFRHPLRLVIRFLAYFAAFFFLYFAFWVNNNFGKPSIEQMLYHLQFGLQGIVDTDIKVVHSFIRQCLVTPFIIASAILALEVFLAYYLIAYAKTYTHHNVGAGIGLRPKNELLAHPFLHRVGKTVYWLIHHRAPLYCLLGCFIFFSVDFSLLTYISQKFGRDYFAENYLNPKNVEITLGKPGKPKNLVLIYVESLENSYRDPGLFKRNLLKSLDDIGGVSFDYYRQAPGTNWTIAGITATQCGLPLKSITLYDGNGQGQNIKSFLPNAICLGDILHAHGYYNVYYGGDALDFSGKGKFFADHHYDERYGRDELKANLVNPQFNYWGLYDDDLFAQAKLKLKALHEQKKLFNFTITTIDTHGPEGYFSNLCKQLGAKDFADIVECTSSQVTDFINFIKKNGYLTDTNVVVLGDHLAMYNPAHEILDAMPKRYIYNQFISRKKVTKTRDYVLHFDMFPTMLEFLGFHVKGGKLGLGFTAITPRVAKPEANELEMMEEDLLNESETYIDLWRQEDLESPSTAVTPEKS